MVYVLFAKYSLVPFGSVSLSPIVCRPIIASSTLNVSSSYGISDSISRVGLYRDTTSLSRGTAVQWCC